MIPLAWIFGLFSSSGRQRDLDCCNNPSLSLSWMLRLSLCLWSVKIDRICRIWTKAALSQHVKQNVSPSWSREIFSTRSWSISESRPASIRTDGRSEILISTRNLHICLCISFVVVSLSLEMYSITGTMHAVRLRVSELDSDKDTLMQATCFNYNM